MWPQRIFRRAWGELQGAEAIRAPSLAAVILETLSAKGEPEPFTPCAATTAALPSLGLRLPGGAPGGLPEALLVRTQMLLPHAQLRWPLPRGGKGESKPSCSCQNNHV